MGPKRIPAWLYVCNRSLPFVFLLLFVPLAAVYLTADPGRFLTAWVTFSIIALATESTFTGVGDLIRHWRRRRSVTPGKLEELELRGKQRLFELRAIALDDPDGAAKAHDIIEDVEDVAADMRPGVDWRLMTRSNLWSIAVYGLSAVVSFNAIDWLSAVVVRHGWSWLAFFTWPWYLRGCAYAPAIFAWEFAWGWAIEHLVGICPWRYQRSLLKWRRYIRPQFAGFWFVFGFALEWTHRQLVPLIVSAFTVLPHR